MMRRVASLARLAGALLACGILAGCALFKGGANIAVAPIVVVAAAGDTAASLAESYLGDADLAWMIEDANEIDAVEPGMTVLVPDPDDLRYNGFSPSGYQTVPILTYHRFTSGRYRGDRLEIAAADFEAQLDYLNANGYRVISMADLGRALKNGDPIPRRAVVITIDDGFDSAYEVAYPIIRKTGVPATVYVYSDFVGAGAALSWDEMREMVASGLVDIQPHSKTHADLTLKRDGETDAAWRDRVRGELTAPAEVFEDRLGVRAHSFAYPYGGVTAEVAALAEETGYDTAVTVTRGGNARYAAPYLLRRTMVFGDHSMRDFQRFLDVEAGY